VRSRLAWFLGAIGVAWLIARLRRRRQPAATPPAEGQADELRKTLEESRAAADQIEAQPAAPPETPEAAGASDVETRRQDVHDRGRAAVDEMNPPSSD
jgi:hypothetical protein